MFNLHELENSVEGIISVIGNYTVEITQASDLNNAGPNSIIWVSQNNKSIKDIISSTLAGMIVCYPNEDVDFTKFPEKIFVFCSNPKLVFARIINKYFINKKLIGIHPSATVDSTASIDSSSYVGANCHIGSDVIIEKNTVISPGCVIGDGVFISKNVVIGPGCCIGQSGFGFVKNENGNYESFPQIGSVRIGSNVELGANVCIDRGALSVTSIGDGTKIDNLCHIAHNVSIDENCILTAGVKVAGSVKMGSNVWVGPSAVILEKLTIGDNSFICIGSVVLRNVLANTKVFGSPAKRIGEV